MYKPLILIVNDDGIFAGGIAALVDVASQIGEVVVVAPDSPQSAKGHSITINGPIRLNRDKKIFKGIESYECSGTPVDCVKLAKNVILKDRKIDLCLSGVNHGSNSSINIIYSGTMGAAMEASLEGIPSIGFSLLDYSMEANFDYCKPKMIEIAQFVLKNYANQPILLNVNFPKLEPHQNFTGIKVCRQGEANWIEEFVEATDPQGRKYYWLTGKFENQEADATDTDVWALENNYISIVPSIHDLTDYKRLSAVGQQFLEFEKIK